METIVENPEDKPALSFADIFKKIWYSPKEVFRYINEHQYEKYIYILLILGGISRSFSRAILKSSGDDWPFWAVILMCVIGGGVLGWITFYLYAAALSWTGKWIKGNGDTKSILRMMAYGLIPFIVELVFLIPLIVLFGNEMFKEYGDISSESSIVNILVYGSLAIQDILTVWTCILIAIGLSQVQKFSIVYSIVNLLLPIILIFIPVGILVFIFFKN